MFMKARLYSSIYAGVLGTVMIAAPASAQVRRINISSTPPGATVRIDNATSPPVGTSPIRNRSVRAGAHTLFFELAGYVPGRLDINVARNGETFTGSLQQAGSINISSDIPGAAVTIDGQQRGVSPVRVDGLAPGQHVVELRSGNLPAFTQTVNVQGGQVAALTAALRPAVGTVRVILSNPAGAVPANVNVSLDGTPLTGSPPASDQVAVGSHVIQVSAEGFRSVTQSVTVAANQVQAIPVTLEAVVNGGTVRVVTSTSGAEVFLDGDRVQGSPAVAQSVAAGTHTVRVSAPGRATVTRDITVTAGQVTALDVGELAQGTQTGRISVRASVADAEVVLDGTSVGRAPYERADAPPGEHIVIIRAPGHEEVRRNCTVSNSAPCEIVADLQRSRPTGVLHVEATNTEGVAIPNAIVRIGDETEARPLGDISVPAGETRVTVSADNHEPQTMTVSVMQGATANARIRLSRTGMSGADVARRRGAISTFGASPLVRGDAAFDLMGGFLGHPLTVRATMGFMPHGLFAVDGGITIRTTLTYYEFELRSRVGLRLASDTFAVGAEGRFYGALGTSERGGIGGTLQFNLSAHFSLANDETVAGETQQDRANRLGSFAITLSPGVQFDGDSYKSNDPPTLSVNNGSGSTAYRLCENAPGANGSALPMGVTSSSDCTLSATIRGYIAGTVEIGLGRHLNAFAGMQYFFARPDTASLGATSSGSNSARRPVLSSFWDNASQAFIYGGVTYKF
jgi:hypothetical protein